MKASSQVLWAEYPGAGRARRSGLGVVLASIFILLPDNPLAVNVSSELLMDLFAMGSLEF
jgi:hypothetical protein